MRQRPYGKLNAAQARDQACKIMSEQTRVQPNRNCYGEEVHISGREWKRISCTVLRMSILGISLMRQSLAAAPQVKTQSEKRPALKKPLGYLT
jgi:hypothetical protein